MATILVVEDERDLAQVVRMNLEAEGHTVYQAADGAAALEWARHEELDLIVLDLMLPKVDGLEVCRRIRRTSITPILMLTAKGTELDRVLGLEMGADDYLVKPFAMRELLARIGAILRRVEMMREAQQEPDAEAVIDLPGLHIDPAAHDVVADGRPVTLTAKEFALLHLLAANPGRVFNREYLLERIWGDDYEGLDRTVDTHMLRLRKKLGGTGTVADRIATLWGVGYRFEREQC
jgi:DNA-binding response OmpR family regulator